MPSIPARNKEKGYLPILLLMILAAVGAGAIIIFLKPNLNVKPIENTSVAVSESLVADDSNDRVNKKDVNIPFLSNKTQVTDRSYLNQLLNFQVMVDNELTVKEDSEEEYDKRGNGAFRNNFKYSVTYEPGKFLGAVVVLDKTNSYENSPFTLWVFGNSNNFSIERWYQNYWYYPFVWGDYTSRRDNVAPIHEASISGQIAQYGVVTYRDNAPKFIYLLHKGNMYLFRIIGDTGEKILSSFKFVN